MANSQRPRTNESKISSEISQIEDQIETVKRQLFQYAVKLHYYDDTEFVTFNKKIEQDIDFTQFLMWALYRKNHLNIYEENIELLFNHLRELKCRIIRLKKTNLFDSPLNKVKQSDPLVLLESKNSSLTNKVDEAKLKQQLKIEIEKLNHYAKSLHIEWKALPNIETADELEDVVLQFKQKLFEKLDEKNGLFIDERNDLWLTDAGRFYKSSIPRIEACFDAIRNLQIQCNLPPKAFFTQPRMARMVDSKSLIKENGPWEEAIQEFKRPAHPQKRKHKKLRSGVKFPFIKWKTPVDSQTLNKAIRKIFVFLTKLLAVNKETTKKAVSAHFIEKIVNSQKPSDDILEPDRYKLLHLVITENYKIFNKALRSLIKLKKLSLILLEEKTKNAFFTIKPPHFNNNKIPHKLDSIEDWADNWIARIEKFQFSVEDKERNSNDSIFWGLGLDERKDSESYNIFFEINDKQTELCANFKNRLNQIRYHLNGELAELTEELKRKNSHSQPIKTFGEMTKEDQVTLISKQVSLLDNILIDDDNIEALVHLANLIETEWQIPIGLKENLFIQIKANALLQKFYIQLTEYRKLMGTHLIDLPSLNIDNIPENFNEIAQWAERTSLQFEKILDAKKIEILRNNLNKFNQELKSSAPLNRSQTYTLKPIHKKEELLATESTPLLASLPLTKSTVSEEIPLPPKKTNPLKGPSATCTTLMFFGAILLCIPGVQLIGLGMIKIGFVGLLMIAASKAYQKWKCNTKTISFDDDNRFFRSNSASSLPDKEATRIKSQFYEQKRPAARTISVTPTAPSIQGTPKMKFFDRNPVVTQEPSRLIYRGRAITAR